MFVTVSNFAPGNGQGLLEGVNLRKTAALLVVLLRFC
jgi:hypothetical protein